MAAHREVNYPKLRTLAHMEASIQDVDKSIPKLRAQMNADRKKILNLNNTVDQIDSKCEDLQKTMEEMGLDRKNEGIKITNAIRATENLIKRPALYGNNSRISNHSFAAKCDELKENPKKEHCKIVLTAAEKLLAKEMIDKAENDLASLLQEYEDYTRSIQKMADFEGDFENDKEAPYECIIKVIKHECALVKLLNGDCAWICKKWEFQKPDTRTVSRLKELIDEFRMVIAKYKPLTEAKEVQRQPRRLVKKRLDNMSSPFLNRNMTNIRPIQNPKSPQQRQWGRCSVPKSGSTSKSKNAEEFSKIKTPERDNKRNCKSTQTGDFGNNSNNEIETQTPSLKNLSSSTQNLRECLFQDRPVYKRLFQEIFEVLKKNDFRKPDT